MKKSIQTIIRNSSEIKDTENFKAIDITEYTSKNDINFLSSGDGKMTNKLSKLIYSFLGEFGSTGTYLEDSKLYLCFNSADFAKILEFAEQNNLDVTTEL